MNTIAKQKVFVKCFCFNEKNDKNFDIHAKNEQTPFIIVSVYFPWKTNEAFHNSSKFPLMTYYISYIQKFLYF